jgi:transposase-like protein
MKTDEMKSYVINEFKKGIVHPNPLTQSEMKVLKLCSEWFASQQLGLTKERIVEVFEKHFGITIRDKSNINYIDESIKDFADEILTSSLSTAKMPSEVYYDCPNCGDRMTDLEFHSVKYDYGCPECKTSFSMFKKITLPAERVISDDDIEKWAKTIIRSNVSIHGIPKAVYRGILCGAKAYRDGTIANY